jgi:spore germination cell wall hydrolase CwlJ-like protein
MIKTWCLLAAALLASPTLAAEDAITRDADPRPLEEKAQAAEKKGEVLEEKASASGDKKAPLAAEKISKPEAQAVDPRGQKALDDALTCLARSIYWEAKGEGRAGMEAVASVVMNRLGRESFPNTVCGVVKEGKETGACQFSWWCDGRPDDVEEENLYTIAKEIARQALNRQLPDPTGGALYFHSVKVTAVWDNDYVETAEIGGHRFYKPKDGKDK